ncbi:MAG: family 78 glycoside hydrolase catalytic domain [Deferribacteres bacterium]|nr:family 78 glycoside hydrolase catalytic domain [Deferribacteres bacterium]
MKVVSKFMFLVAVLVMVQCTTVTRMTVESPTCEYRENPLGIDVQQPRLSWICNSIKRGEQQTAYHILVASSKENLHNDIGDIWDSQKVESSQSIQLHYAGADLQSDRDYFWKVRVWDKDGQPSEWSKTAMWSTGLLQPEDWQAKWIGMDKAVGEDAPKDAHTKLSARMLRKEFSLDKKVKRATTFISGLGLFELYVNGEKIGDQVLAPGLTEYNKRAFYMAFDVTQHMQKSNAIGVVLGNGRYFAPRSSEPARTRTYGFPKLLLQTHIQFDDGTSEIIVSDETWKLTTDGPIRKNNEYDGEFYDARKEMPGWDQPGFDDSRWIQAELVEKPGEKIVAQMAEPIKVTETRKPIAVNEVEPGIFIFDMGQNMVGWVRINVKGEKGEKVTLRFAETLQDNGHLFMENIRGAEVTDTYILKSSGTETWEPRFTYHGFRFVEMKGEPARPSLSALEGRVVHDAVKSTGTFKTSNSTINQVYRNAFWGIRGNYRSMPTDCPQRDERQGWLGDRSVESLGESFMFNIAGLYNKWLVDIQDAQNEEGSIPDVAPSYWPFYNDNMTWPGSYVIFPGMLYKQYGDLEAIKKHYPSMQKWLRYMEKYVHDGIVTKDNYGDWCVPPLDITAIHSSDPKRITSAELIATAYYYSHLKTMAFYANLLDKKDDASVYLKHAQEIYKTFNEHFYDENLQQYGNNSQTSNVLALAFGLVPEDRKAHVFQNLIDNILGVSDGHIGTGLIGSQFLMRVLTDNGRPDIAYKLASNTTYPSWGYMAEKGATTIWELWNGDTGAPGMNSHNHVMLLGDLLVWLYENLAGISSDFAMPAFKHIQMKPEIPVGLEFVDASYNSDYGVIKSHWKIDDGTFKWDITIPANTTATIAIPAVDTTVVYEGGAVATEAEGVSFDRVEGNRIYYNVASGEYRFESRKFTVDKFKQFVSMPVLAPEDTTVAYPAKINIRMKSRTPEAKIYFTVDGNEPDESAMLYSSPIAVENSTTIKARAFKNDDIPSITEVMNYDFVEPGKNGIHWQLYQGSFTMLPDFSKLEPVKEGTTYQFSLHNMPVPKENFALVYTSYLKIEKAGTYDFALNSNDGSQLFVNGKLLIDNDGEHGPRQLSGNIMLQPGFTQLRVTYFQSGGTTALGCYYKGPELERRTIPGSRLYLRSE